MNLLPLCQAKKRMARLIQGIIQEKRRRQRAALDGGGEGEAGHHRGLGRAPPHGRRHWLASSICTYLQLGASACCQGVNQVEYI